MRVAVLGAGLQGVAVALELALAGVDVHLYDRSHECLTRSSVNNEGKLHLGYVYAHDGSLRTARRMISGGVRFASVVRRWVGSALDAVPVSSPFLYAVHERSFVDADRFERHLEQCRAAAVEESADLGLDYFGSDYRARSIRLGTRESRGLLDDRFITAAFRTPEIAIDSRALAGVLRARVAAEPRIERRMRTEVRGVVRDDEDTLVVEYEQGSGRCRARYAHVVNALWDGRLAVDESLGLRPPRPLLYRVKHFVLVRAPRVAGQVPSVTIVLGAYGDVVSYANDWLYLSWYPTGLRGLSRDTRPSHALLSLDSEESEALDRSTRDALAAFVPAIAALTGEAVESAAVGGGVIVAWGETDIDDRGSMLHERHRIGPSSLGRYHSIDTGKLTMAPYFGRLVAERIVAAG